MKKSMPAMLVAIVLVTSLLHSFAQIPTHNQPVGNLVYGPDGVIYGAFTGKNPEGQIKRASTIYKYTPGESTIDPVYHSNDHVLEVHAVDTDGYIYGTAVQYDENEQPIYSRVIRVKNDGSGYKILYNHSVASAGFHKNLMLIGDYVYGIRTSGGPANEGVLFYVKKSGGDYFPYWNYGSAISRPTSIIPHFAWDSTQYWSKGALRGFWIAMPPTAGTFGKGAVLGTDTHMNNIVPPTNFVGYGEGFEDGEGSVSLVADNEFNLFAVTQQGGINNHGAVFLIHPDGVYKSWDFNAQHGHPFGKPFVNGEGKLFGLGGDFDNNSGFIYRFFIEDTPVFSAIPFNASSSVNGVTSIVVANNGVIYGTSRSTGSDSENGSLFAINQDGSNTHVIFKFVDGYSRLLQPYDKQTNVSINPLIWPYIHLDVYTVGYTVELSENPDFTGTVLVNHDMWWAPRPLLKYSTTYYARVKTSLVDDYGQVTSFTTCPPETNSFVSLPLNGATNVAINGLRVTANVVYGATSYTIELNTSADFTGTAIVRSSAVANQRTIIFDGLQPSTTYYSRTRTNFPSNWGPTRSFTTAAAAPPPAFVAETRELKVYPNPFERDFTIEPAESEELNVTLVDLTGRELVKTQVIQQPATLGEQLAPGIYLLRIKENNGRVSVKRMIKNQ